MRISCLMTAMLAPFLMTLASSCATSKTSTPSDKYSGAGFFGQSVVDGTLYSSAISGQTLASAPKWFPEKGEPPLSPRAAVRAARPALATLVGDPQPWELDTIKLFHPFNAGDLAGFWFYEVSFGKEGKGDEHGSVANIYILMNGKVIPIELSKTQAH